MRYARLFVVALALTGGAVGAATAPQNTGSQDRVCVYRSGGALPDATCTPGAYSRAVTQRTIATTICHSGWAATQRPPQAVTEPMKFASMRAYGVPTTPGHAQLYEYDHLVPIELGGAPGDARNLWPEPHTVPTAQGDQGSYTKDGRENRMRALVCAHVLTLRAARHIMRTDWRQALP